MPPGYEISAIKSSSLSASTSRSYFRNIFLLTCAEKSFDSFGFYLYSYTHEELLIAHRLVTLVLISKFDHRIAHKAPRE